MGENVLRGLFDVARNHQLWIDVLSIRDRIEQVGETGNQRRLARSFPHGDLQG